MRKLTEFNRPYCNWSRFRQIGSELKSQNETLATRYSAFIGSKEENDLIYARQEDKKFLCVKAVDLKNTDLLTCEEIRRMISCRVGSKLAGPSSLTANAISKQTGVDFAILSRIKTSTINSEIFILTLPDGTERPIIPDDIVPFAVPVQCIPGVADAMFRVSCHNLFFGEECPTFLPDLYSAAARCLATLDDRVKNNILTKARELKKVAIDSYYKGAVPPSYANNYANFRDPGVILQERLTELDCEVPTVKSRYVLFTDSSYISLKFYRPIISQRSGLRPGAAKGVPKAARGAYIANLNQILFWILETNSDPSFRSKSADFFIANDYIRVDGGVSDIPLPHPPVIMYKKNPHTNLEERPQYKPEDYEQLTDIDTLRILSFCVALPQEQKQELLKKIFSGDHA